MNEYKRKLCKFKRTLCKFINIIYLSTLIHAIFIWMVVNENSFESSTARRIFTVIVTLDLSLQIVNEQGSHWKMNKDGYALNECHHCTLYLHFFLQRLAAKA